MKELIAVTKEQIGEEEIKTVNAKVFSACPA